MPRPGTANGNDVAGSLRQGSRNRLSPMDFPGSTPFANQPPKPTSSTSGDRTIGNGNGSGAPAARPFGRDLTGRFSPTNPTGPADAPGPTQDADWDQWPEGDWVPGHGDSAPSSSWAASAGAISGAVAPGVAAPQPDARPVPGGDLEVTGEGVGSSAPEWPVSDPPRRSGAREPVGAEREVLLWQRWVRYFGAGLMGGAAMILHAQVPHGGTWAPLAVLALAYGAVTVMVAWFLGYASAETVPPRLPALVMTFDLIAAAGTVYLTAPARDYDRMLVLGLAVVQVAVVYYGLSCALWGLGGTAAAYLIGSLLLPPAVPGMPATRLTVAVDTATFAFAGLVLLYTFGTFRARMNALRRFCRDVEVGDLGGTFDANGDRRPDDLTLLARSVDEMRQRLIELIGTDPLTGCLNRRALETRLARDCRHARRRGVALAVLAVDVDHFKSINDSFGHPFGDYVLQEVAEIMKETARDTDAVARLGGDEFILVLPDTGWQGATAFAERLRRNVDDHIFGDDVTSLQVTISVGVAVARAVDDQPPEALLADADRSLYRAKSAGRNRISA